MKVINIDKVEPGMILAREVINSRGMVLVKKGAELSQDIITGLRRHGITEICITEEGDRNRKEFSPEEIHEAMERCREEVMKRFFVLPDDSMTHALFNAVLENAAKRELSGEAWK